MDWILPLITLTAMEVVLGIDNIIFLSILVGALPPERQKTARFVGLGLALGARMALLLGIKWVMGLQAAIFHWSSILRRPMVEHSQLTVGAPSFRMPPKRFRLRQIATSLPAMISSWLTS